MKKLFLIPGMALLVILGISFTDTGSETDAQIEKIASDYVQINGNWEAIPEQNCNSGQYTCQVKFSENGPVYDVYDEMNLSTLRNSTSPDPKLINP